MSGLVSEIKSKVQDKLNSSGSSTTSGSTDTTSGSTGSTGASGYEQKIDQGVDNYLTKEGVPQSADSSINNGINTEINKYA
ncbi:hypothetical protein Q5752_005993 [Cryptotrichosporon argae]